MRSHHPPPPAPSTWRDARIKDMSYNSKFKKKTGPYQHVTCYQWKEGGNFKEGWVCNYCEMAVCQLLVVRMIYHLSGEGGNGIQPCVKVRIEQQQLLYQVDPFAFSHTLHHQSRFFFPLLLDFFLLPFHFLQLFLFASCLFTTTTTTTESP